MLPTRLMASCFTYRTRHQSNARQRIAALLLITVCLPLATWAQTEKPIRVGSESAFLPFAGIDAKGQSTGFAVELFAAVTQEAGIPTVFESDSWNKVWQQLQNGEVDALPLVARIKEREGLVEFTQPHTYGYDSFFVRCNGPKISSIEDARNLNIIVIRSDAAEDILKDRGFKRQLIAVDNLDDGLRLLASGQHDALLAPALQGNRQVELQKLGEVIKSGPLLREYRREYSFAVRKGNIALRDKLDRALILVKANGEYDRLYRKWLRIYEPAPSFPIRYAIWGASGLALVVAILALWTVVLRRQVALRTAQLMEANAVLEHRVAERTAALAESEARFRGMADAAPAFIWMSGPERACTWFNAQWLTFTGRNLDEELGMGWTDGLHPDDRERCVTLYQHAFDQRRVFEAEYRVRRADGEYRWIADRAEPRLDMDGHFLGYIGACVDVTERKWAEDALREDSLKLQRFIDGAPVGIAMLDTEMRYLAVSRRFLEDFNLTHDIVGQSTYEVFPDIPQRWRLALQRCLAGETLSCAEDEFHRADGSGWWLRWEVKPWFTGPREIGGVLLFAEDVTASKQSADALRAAKAEAERANAAKSRFLAAASHDLRQPLSALSLYVGILDSKLPASEYLLAKAMKGCVDNLNEMLNNLLDLSKLDAGVVHPKISDFPLMAMMARLADSHGPEAEEKGLSLRCRSVDLVGRSDPVLFQRIVSNLVSNAIRYTEKGGVLIGCRRRGGKTWVEVWDTGVGIPSDKTEEIFEEFRQLNNEERDRTKGTGLGLAIVARTAALLGLKIRVHSHLDKGSVFAVELPLGKNPTIAPPHTYTHRPLRIAVVEDNREVVAALTHVLSHLGHEVIAGNSREKLMQALGGKAPNIVISDYRLGGYDSGLDVIAHLRDTFAPTLPAILITGDTDPAIIRHMTAHQIVVKHKPLDLDALRARIAELTTNARLSLVVENLQNTWDSSPHSPRISL
ncbi:MAG TPA: transporter substrate-binding domain-containing protein [Rhodocyclaceae bacterium]|nr:transporter substrate-binding domain-containing protein [Rhodocyclaceae bacterium]